MNENNFDNYNENNDVTPSESSVHQNDAQNSGYYSYKRPDIANDPQYSATTQSFQQSPTEQYQPQQAEPQPPYQATTQQYQSAQPQPQVNNYQHYSAYSNAVRQTNKKAKPKEKKKVSLASLVACCLICAIVASALSVAGAVYLADKLNLSQNATNNTVINVDKSSSNVVSAVAQKVVPSVVGIRVTASVTTFSFFGYPQQNQQSSEGSGIIYTSDGYIITNYHVISAAVEAEDKSLARISVYLPSDTENAIDAEVVGYYSESDIAVIKINKKGLPAAEFADSDKLTVGEPAIAVGNPGGLEFISSVSSGIVSGLNRTIKLEGTSEMKLIQTDAAINPGNSGGALANQYGKIIGVNSSKISSTDFEGMGFAIPSNHVKQLCDDIINNKDVKKAYLGIKISTEYDSDMLESMGYPAGAVVEDVEEGSPADNVGIKQSDIITSFDGVKITDYNSYNNERLKHKPNENVTLVVYRSGRYYNVSVTLGSSNS